MIGVSKLLCGLATESDGLRYKDARHSGVAQIKYRATKKSERPIVVWNMTRACNLRCIHCYANAIDRPEPGELSTQEAKRLIDDLARFQVPVLLFSGGEPFLRADLFELGSYAAGLGLRPVISTNGTLITEEKAEKAKEAGFRYIGISLDGVGEGHDRFRGVRGAFRQALEGIRNSKDVGMKTGLRYTITKANQRYFQDVLDLAAEERLDRICVYHLDYSGRASAKMDISPQETREAVELYFDWTRRAYGQGSGIEALLVGNYADAPFLYLYAREKLGQARAERIYELLKRNCGDGSGETIADIDYRGDVHPNQFWWDYSLGNVKERPFSEIWTDLRDPVLQGLRNRKDFIKGRCAECRFFEICKGGSRIRAQAIYNDLWAPDPACYLSEEEIDATSRAEASSSPSYLR